MLVGNAVPGFSTGRSCFDRELGCYENNVPVDINMEQSYRKQLQEYHEKLKIDLFKAPGPFSSKSGWVGDKQDIIK